VRRCIGCAKPSHGADLMRRVSIRQLHAARAYSPDQTKGSLPAFFSLASLRRHGYLRCVGARRAGVERLVGVYVPTTKNDLVKAHYDRLGFARRGPSDNHHIEYRLTLTVPLSPRRLPNL